MMRRFLPHRTALRPPSNFRLCPVQIPIRHFAAEASAPAVATPASSAVGEPGASTSSSSSSSSSSSAKAKPQPGMLARTRSFTYGVIFASGVSFWVLLLEGQKMLERLENSVQKVMEYQARVEKRLEKVETAAGIAK
ncbi:unnamed protein product [Amoebophrya sp. A25]|nr:unnamed protein product [Amoebophrya sp. A25]|eukprot:GSA25T00005713001.1